MKVMKWLVPLAVVVLVLMIALPASAQGPYTAGPNVHVRTYNGPLYVVNPGTNEDPFGGFPIPGSGGQPGALGAPGNFGRYPWNSALPGGVPSNKSGDGSSPRKAINVGGPWSAVYTSGEQPWELPGCVTVKIPAATSKWVKAETWKNVQLIYWVDDELNDATKASGNAVFGAANAYMYSMFNPLPARMSMIPARPPGLSGTSIARTSVCATVNPSSARTRVARSGSLTISRRRP